MFDCPKLHEACAAANAARQFHAPHRVTLPLNPSIPGHQERIDEASAWARSDERIGRSRRIANASDSRTTFEFENVADAVECHLLFF